MGMDWGRGRYETTAAQLLPAARLVVDRAAPAAGERVVDIGCGTGNAALLAAERGARVIGVDPAGRLLEVAREAAAARGVDATFGAGEAAHLPLGDGSVDVALSVFAVIFAPDPRAAAAEISRVLTSAGRLVLSAWIPQGTMMDLVGVLQEAVARALGAPLEPPGFAWHDRDALGGLLGPHGFRIAMSEERLVYTAASARAFLEAQLDDHPMSVAGRAVLGRDPAGAARVYERALGVLEIGNEDPHGFRVTSRYVVATARRP